MAFTILIIPYSPFQKSETLESWQNWLLSNWSRLLNWKELELSPSPPNCLKDSWELLPFLISISWTSLLTQWVVAQKIYSKMHPVSCTNTHHDITDLVNLGIAKITKTWIPWEWNITFPKNKKVLNQCLRWHILRSYHFEAEVTFKFYSVFSQG